MHSFICHALGFELCYLERVPCQPLNGNLALKMRVHCEKDFVQWKTGYISRPILLLQTKMFEILKFYLIFFGKSFDSKRSHAYIRMRLGNA